MLALRILESEDRFLYHVMEITDQRWDQMYKRSDLNGWFEKSDLAAQAGIDLAKALGAEVLALNVINGVVVPSAVRQLGSDRKEVEDKLMASGRGYRLDKEGSAALLVLR